MEFPSWLRPSVSYIRSDSWRQILQNNGDVIPDTLWRFIYFKCGKLERYCHPSSVILGSSTLEELKMWKKYEDLDKEVLSSKGKNSIKMEFGRKYEDLGKQVLSSKDTPDWKNVKENLQRMYNEYISAIEEFFKAYELPVEGTIPKGKGRLAHDDGEPKRKIQIKVKTVKGLEHVFKGMSTRDLILDFKRKIASQIGGIVEDEIILLYGDKELCDNNTLDTYGITNGETVFMLQRLRRKGLMETARYLYNEARNVLKCLGEWVPGLFADSTRALTTKELSKVAQEIGMNWELLGPALGLDSVQMDHITEDNPSSTVKKIYTMLTTWLNENQGEATVGKLYQAMNDCNKVRFNWTKIKNIFSGVDAVFIRG